MSKHPLYLIPVLMIFAIFLSGSLMAANYHPASKKNAACKSSVKKDKDPFDDLDLFMTTIDDDDDDIYGKKKQDKNYSSDLPQTILCGQKPGFICFIRSNGFNQTFSSFHLSRLSDLIVKTSLRV